MKNLLIVSTLAVLFISFEANAQNITTEQHQETINSVDKTIKFKITGITCAGCSNTIYKTLENVDGVIEHSVEYPGDIAIIKFDDTKTNIEELKNIIEKKGYKVELIKPKS
ncbi:MAG: heavy-metal-associated domain-containing protein [Flavobacteriaceae bacterium]